eukprot:6428852-Pyramimonas_sp.AAC.1
MRSTPSVVVFVAAECSRIGGVPIHWGWGTQFCGQCGQGGAAQGPGYPYGLSPSAPAHRNDVRVQRLEQSILTVTIQIRRTTFLPR